MTEKVATSADELAASYESASNHMSHMQYGGNVGKSLTTDQLMEAVLVKHGRQTGKSELTMFQMFLQTALAEVAEYNVQIKSAKTQAKRDYYQKKIKNVTKRLQKLLP